MGNKNTMSNENVFEEIQKALKQESYDGDLLAIALLTPVVAKMEDPVC